MLKAQSNIYFDTQPVEEKAKGLSVVVKDQTNCKVHFRQKIDYRQLLYQQPKWPVQKQISAFLQGKYIDLG